MAVIFKQQCWHRLFAGATPDHSTTTPDTTLLAYDHELTAGDGSGDTGAEHAQTLTSSTVAAQGEPRGRETRESEIAETMVDEVLEETLAGMLSGDVRQFAHQ